MSARSLAYQVQNGGRPGEAYVLNGLKFDARVGNTLIDAKGRGYAQWVKNGNFKANFYGTAGMVADARRQLRAADGAKIRWVFAEKEAAEATRALFKREKIDGIEITHEPPKPPPSPSGGGNADPPDDPQP